MTLARPYAYWVRNNGYLNTWPSDDNGVINRCSAVRSVEDQLVRTYLHSVVNMSVTTTSPPPKDWFYAVDLVAIAGYSPSPTSTMQQVSGGDVGTLITSRLVFTGNWPVASPGVDVASWAQQRTESARVYQSAPADNSDYPCVQSGISVEDHENVLFHFPAYSISFYIKQYLETLWASSVPPG